MFNRLVLIYSCWLVAACNFSAPLAQSSDVPDDVPASTIVVDTTADELIDNGNCSLREAIQAANLDILVDTCGPGTERDIIRLPQGTYAIEIPGIDEDDNQTGDLDVRGNITVIGEGAGNTSIDGDDVDRVFEVLAAGRLTLNDLAVTRGSIFNDHGGGIFNAGVAVVQQCEVRDNSAWGGWGGGIYNSGELTVRDSTVLDNMSIGEDGVPGRTPGGSGGGGGGAGMGGGLFNDIAGVATVTDSSFTRNFAFGGFGGDGADNGSSFFSVTGGDGGGPLHGTGGIGGGSGGQVGQPGADGGFGSGGGGGSSHSSSPGAGGLGGYGGGGGGGGARSSGGSGGTPGSSMSHGGAGSAACCSGGGGGGGGAGIGGAIFDGSGTAMLSTLDFSDNQVQGGSGGTDAFGNPGNPGADVSPDVHVLTQ